MNTLLARRRMLIGRESEEMKEWKLIANETLDGADSFEIALDQEIKEFIVCMKGVVALEETGMWLLYLNDVQTIPGAASSTHAWGGYWQWHGTYIDGCWEIAVTAAIKGDFDNSKNASQAQTTYTQMNFQITEPARTIKVAMSEGVDNAAKSGHCIIYGK